MTNQDELKLINIQKKKSLLGDEILKLQELYERTHLPSLKRIIEIRSSEAKALYFSNAMMFEVPNLEEFVGKGIIIGLVDIEAKP